MPQFTPVNGNAIMESEEIKQETVKMEDINPPAEAEIKMEDINSEAEEGVDSDNAPVEKNDNEEAEKKKADGKNGKVSILLPNRIHIQRYPDHCLFL